MATPQMDDMFPDMVPIMARRIWAAKLKHDRDDRTGAPFTLEIGQRLLKRDGQNPWSKSAISRAVHDKKLSKWLPWGLLKTRSARPPWETKPELLDDAPVTTSPEDSPEQLPLDRWLLEHPDGRLVVDKDSVVRAVVRSAEKLTAVAAGLMGVSTLLDLVSDGKFNHVIAWCRLLVTLHLRA